MQMPEEWGDLLSRRMRINPLSSVLREEETAKALKALQCKSSGQAGVSSIQCLQGKVLPCVLGGHCQQLCHCWFNPLCCWFTFFPALLRVPLAFILHVWKSRGGFKLHLMKWGLWSTVWQLCAPLPQKRNNLILMRVLKAMLFASRTLKPNTAMDSMFTLSPSGSAQRPEKRGEIMVYIWMLWSWQKVEKITGDSFRERKSRKGTDDREHGNSRGAQGLSLLLLASWGLCVSAGATLQQQLVSGEYVVFWLLCPGENTFACLYPPDSNVTSHPVWVTHLVLRGLCCYKPCYWPLLLVLQPLLLQEVLQPPLL